MVRNGKYEVYIGIEEEGKSIWFVAVLGFSINIRLHLVFSFKQNRINVVFIPWYLLIMSIPIIIFDKRVHAYYWLDDFLLEFEFVFMLTC